MDYLEHGRTFPNQRVNAGPDQSYRTSDHPREGLSQARDLAEHAFVMAEQVGDPCWESLALRTLGLLSVDRGDLGRGMAMLEQAPMQCQRLPDTYRWIDMWGYAALVEVGDRHGLDATVGWRAQLEAEATAMGMRPLATQARAAAAQPRGASNTA